MGSRDHCCLCGAARKPTQQPLGTFSNGTEIVNMAKHRPMLPGRWEASPQLLVSVSMWRNGGVTPGETHMCDDCIAVGLRRAKVFIDAALAALDPATGTQP